jgi:hypothetical protein
VGSLWKCLKFRILVFLGICLVDCCPMVASKVVMGLRFDNLCCFFEVFVRRKAPVVGRLAGMAIVWNASSELSSEYCDNGEIQNWIGTVGENDART